MILVTGATGLVGSHLLAKLVLQHDRIRALYRNPQKIERVKAIFQHYHSQQAAEQHFLKIEWVKADITDIPLLTDAFNEIKQVYHCAGLISYAINDYNLLRKINIEGTANVVNIALKNQVEKFCHVSSISALGDEVGNKAITEDSPRINEAYHDNYSITKYGAEMEVWRASQEGLPVVIVNPGVIIGAGFWDNGSGLLFSKVYNGLSYHFPLTTGFVAVEDVTEAMIRLMNSKLTNEGYILVSENASFTQVLTEIAQSLQKPAPKRELKPWMVAIGWFFQRMGRLLFNTRQEISRHSIKGILGTSYYENQKIKEAVQLNFTPIATAIRHTAKHFKP